MSHLRGKVITALTMLGCPAVSHRHVSSSKTSCVEDRNAARNGCRHPKCTPVTERTCRDSTRPLAAFIVYTPDLEQSGRHHTLQACPETEISLWATLLNTLMRQADTAAHRGRGVGVTARYHNFILPLPAQPLTVTLAETDAQTLRASKHAQAYTQT